MNNVKNNDTTIEFKMIEKVGILTRYQTGWNKELNVVEWDGYPPKFDIRDWNEEHDRMTRGITLHEAEVRKLYELLNERYGGEEVVPIDDEEPDELEPEDSCLTLTEIPEADDSKSA